MGSRNIKDEIRMKVWRTMMERNAALPPFPVFDRIPNFRGAGEAAQRLRRLERYEGAKIVLCNPDSPQRPVREVVLRDGKVLIVATPRLSRGFMVIERSEDPFYDSTIRGIMERGKPIMPGDCRIDLFIAGSVAVSQEGYRLGKGTAYSDTEYSLWKKAGSIDEKTIAITTVHDLQVLDYVPRDEWDVPVDLIITPTRTMWTMLGSKRLGI